MTKLSFLLNLLDLLFFFEHLRLGICATGISDFVNAEWAWNELSATKGQFCQSLKPFLGKNTFLLTTFLPKKGFENIGKTGPSWRPTRSRPLGYIDKVNASCMVRQWKKGKLCNLCLNSNMIHLHIWLWMIIFRPAYNWTLEMKR